MEEKKPRPTREIYEELQLIKDQMKQDEYIHSEDKQDRFMEIMNNYDWGVKLFEENGKYGIKSWDGSVLLPAAFEDFRMLSSGLYEKGDRMVVMSDGKEGIVLMNGEDWSWVMKPEFDFITYPSSLVGVKKGELWGIYNLSSGQYLADIELDEIFLHGGGFITVNGIGIFRKGDKYGIMNHYGDITEPYFDEVSMDVEGMLRVRLGDKWGYVNEDGKFEEDEDLAYWGWEV